MVFATWMVIHNSNGKLGRRELRNPTPNGQITVGKLKGTYAKS